MTTIRTSRAIFCHATCTPRMLTSPNFKVPLINTATTIPSKKTRLKSPSTRIGSLVPSSGTTPPSRLNINVSITKNSAIKIILINSMCGKRAVVVQKKGTPCRNPKKSGGSPKGVKEPPILLTRKIKKTIRWTLLCRYALARIKGRMRSIEAPVVPTHEAIAVPISNKSVLTIGVPRNVPRTRIPPATVNNPHNRMMNGI